MEYGNFNKSSLNLEYFENPIFYLLQDDDNVDIIDIYIYICMYVYMYI